MDLPIVQRLKKELAELQHELSQSSRKSSRRRARTATSRRTPSTRPPRRARSSCRCASARSAGGSASCRCTPWRRSRTESSAYGSRVTVEDLEEGTRARLPHRVSRRGDAARGRISLGSPLGRALLNRSVGDEIEVQAPKGKRRYQIVDLVTLHESSGDTTARKRRLKSDEGAPWQYRNLADMFFRRAADVRRQAALPGQAGRRVGRGRWDEHATIVVLRDRRRARRRAASRPGNKVALLSGTRPEWIEVDFAILRCGRRHGPDLPVESRRTSAATSSWNSESACCFVENAKQLREDPGGGATDGFELDGREQRVQLTRLVLIEGEPAGGGVSDCSRRCASAVGARCPASPRRDRRAHRATPAARTWRRSSTRRGRPGPPKGVMQTHGNHLATLDAIERGSKIAEAATWTSSSSRSRTRSRGMVEYLGTLRSAR